MGVETLVAGGAEMAAICQTGATAGLVVQLAKSGLGTISVVHGTGFVVAAGLRKREALNE